MHDEHNKSRIAVVTGASSGIGFELARLAARAGCDLILAADAPDLSEAAADLACFGTNVIAAECDLSTEAGVKALLSQLLEVASPIDDLLANAGRGLGQAFLDQDIHMPGSFQADHNATAAFLDSFAIAFANELKGSGVTVTCLMPGPTDTAFFERANMLDTELGQESKADPAEVAPVAYNAMMGGETGVVAGPCNKLRASVAHLMPESLLAEIYRLQAQPGSGSR